MAVNMKVVSVRRPLVNVADANGATVATAPAAHLEVTVDRYADGTTVQTVDVHFSSHAGLEAEWEAGTATTLLAAAIADALLSVVWRPSAYTPAQRSLVNATIAVEP